MHVTIKTDGGSRGNPGDSASAYVLYDEDGEMLYAYARPIGISTNNVAEYTALLWALEKCHQKGIFDIQVFMDSELIVKQIRGEYQVKNEILSQYYAQIMDLIHTMDSFEIKHILREENKDADALVNLALDEDDEIERFYADFDEFEELSKELSEELEDLNEIDDFEEENRVIYEDLLDYLEYKKVSYLSLYGMDDKLILSFAEHQFMKVVRIFKRLKEMSIRAGYNDILLQIELEDEEDDNGI